MKSNTFSIFMIISLLFMSGCGHGYTVTFHNVIAEIDASDSISIAIAVHDQRAIVLREKERPDYTGSSSREFLDFATSPRHELMLPKNPNPTDVGISGGRSLADEMIDMTRISLSKNGYQVTPVATSYQSSNAEVLLKLKETAAKRQILLTIFRWNSFTGKKHTSLTYDLWLQIFDPSGNELAEKRIRGGESLGGSVWGPESYAKNILPVALRKKIEELFNAPEIKIHLH